MYMYVCVCVCMYILSCHIFNYYIFNSISHICNMDHSIYFKSINNLIIYITFVVLITVNYSTESLR